MAHIHEDGKLLVLYNQDFTSVKYCKTTTGFSIQKAHVKLENLHNIVNDFSIAGIINKKGIFVKHTDIMTTASGIDSSGIQYLKALLKECDEL